MAEDAARVTPLGAPARDPGGVYGFMWAAQPHFTVERWVQCAFSHPLNGIEDGLVGNGEFPARLAQGHVLAHVEGDGVQLAIPTIELPGGFVAGGYAANAPARRPSQKAMCSM